MRFSLAASAMIAAPLLAAYWWGQSDAGLEYRAMKEAERLCAEYKLDCSPAKPRRPKVEDCEAA